MEIRLAKENDETEVCRLWTLLLSFYQKHTTQEVLKRSFSYAIQNPHKVLIYIIVIEGTVTGTVSLHLGHYSTWNDNWYGHVEDLIVDPIYRGRGLATELLKHIIAAARDNNLIRLELNALNDNYTARSLYEKLGFTTDSASYELSISS